HAGSSPGPRLPHPVRCRSCGRPAETRPGCALRPVRERRRYPPGGRGPGWLLPRSRPSATLDGGYPGWLAVGHLESEKGAVPLFLPFSGGVRPFFSKKWPYLVREPFRRKRGTAPFRSSDAATNISAACAVYPGDDG